MKALFVKFNREGIVEMFSQRKTAYHIKITDIPIDFRINPTYYQMCIKNGEIFGVEYRDDLELYIKEEELRIKELELENNELWLI